MADIAGLVLGGIPIAIWALEKYVEPFEAFHNYRISIETFRTALIFQNRQLQTTLCNLGLDNDPSREELRQCFDTKFPSISRELIYIVQRMDDVTAALLKSLDIDINEKSNVLQYRAQWEWHRVKHSLGTKKRNKVVEELRHWNEDLRRSVEKPELPAEDDTGKVQNLKRRFNIERCNSIRQCLSSLHRALEVGFRCACSPPHQAAIDLDWEAIESQTAKSLKVALSYGPNSQTPNLPHLWRKFHVTPHAPNKTASLVPSLQTPQPTPTRSSPTSSSRRPRMWHSKFRSLPRTPPPPPTPPVLSMAPTAIPITPKAEITSLCRAINTDCNQCKRCTLAGFLKDPDEDNGRRFSFDYSQSDLSGIIKAVPLKSLLSSHKQSDRQLNPYISLSAKQRYGIAASAAWSVLHLSGSPWLGDHWAEKQANIFLERNQGGREILSRYPCASYIFLPPISPDQPLKNDFNYLIPNKTVFALGILLIELCIHESFTINRQTDENVTPASLLDDYQTALSKLDEVYSLAGDSYGYAAERCVKFAFQGPNHHNDFSFSQFRRQFHDSVVAPVQATYLTFPDSSIPV
ncbi:uncharacterized protein N7500_001580 [Penicillium coprophilum]|uniref:uncharacterized protein n=1 Tax=Penicillium coprophilum TaxID=36646 RepID=UPI00238D098F|nr:uncharacterized protein N7500_001580 [Penicillium coprophilum]KAJ5173649.1 hypothetical protein N7500_001580 [Penicillium coprophilum]